VALTLAGAEDVGLTPLALELAAQLDGSAGGGQEAAVLWTDMKGIQRMDDGKLYFVMRQGLPAEGSDEGAGPAQEAGGGLWDFAIAGYNLHAAGNEAAAGH
jgi:hypothetical protein